MRQGFSRQVIGFVMAVAVFFATGFTARPSCSVENCGSPCAMHQAPKKESTCCASHEQPKDCACPKLQQGDHHEPAFVSIQGFSVKIPDLGPLPTIFYLEPIQRLDDAKIVVPSCHGPPRDAVYRPCLGRAPPVA